MLTEAQDQTMQKHTSTSSRHTDIAGTAYSFDNSQMQRLEDLSGRVQAMRKNGKLTQAVLGKIRQYFRIKSIYHSNAIEGNTLDMGETRQVVENGLTLTGKSLKDQAEAKNLKEALDFLENLAADATRGITESDIRQIHSFVLKGINDDNAGKYRSVNVKISGSEFEPPSPESLPVKMKDFGIWLSRVSTVDKRGGPLDAILYAAAAHTWFVTEHPFIDGNGRVARLLMNLMLMRYGYPIAIIAKDDRARYYHALEESQSSDLSLFIGLLTECIGESLEEYEAAAQEQSEQKEVMDKIASQLSHSEKVHSKNEYEVWKSAMELLRSYFRQAVDLLNESPEMVGSRVYFKDFGELIWEKYVSLKGRKSAKQTWFFRVDFVSGEKSARYLFFFGFPSRNMPGVTGATLHLAREEPAKSFNYDKLDDITADNVPNIAEIGYYAKEERFGRRGGGGAPVQKGKIEVIGKKFFEEVVAKHFQS